MSTYADEKARAEARRAAQLSEAIDEFRAWEARGVVRLGAFTQSVTRGVCWCGVRAFGAGRCWGHYLIWRGETLVDRCRECDRPIFARGRCRPHYLRWLRIARRCRQCGGAYTAGRGGNVRCTRCRRGVQSNPLCAHCGTRKVVIKSVGRCLPCLDDLPDWPRCAIHDRPVRVVSTGECAICYWNRWMAEHPNAKRRCMDRQKACKRRLYRRG